MKRMVFCGLAALSLSGCAVVRNPCFWRLTVGSVLRAAYASGGAEAVGERIDRLSASGRVSETTAEKLKSAAQKGYDKLQESLAHEAVENLPIDDE